MVDDGEAETIEPASTADEVSAEYGIGGKEYWRVEFDSEGVQCDIVLVGVEITGRRTEAAMQTGFHIQTQVLGMLALKYT